MSGSLSIAHTEASLGWGGQEIRILREAAGFIARGHRVQLFAALGSRILEESARFGVPVTALAIGRKGLPGLAAMTRALDREKFDIVNTHSSTDSWLAALATRLLAARARPVPVLVRTRHVAVTVRNNLATRWLYGRAAATIVTTGEALRAQLIRDNRLDPSRIESIPTGVDPTLYERWERGAARTSLGLPPELPLIGIVATIRSWKGHRYLVDALPLLEHRDAELVIVGDGPQREELAGQVEQRGLAARVRFVGQQQDVAPWLAAMDVFALPSYANEGVPQALLQAMFARVPCVTTDAGAIGEIGKDGETATIVARQDPQALAAGIDRVLADPARARVLVERAYTEVSERYTETAMLDRMEAVFRRTLTAHSQRPRPG